jgi:hypothetical protein
MSIAKESASSEKRVTVIFCSVVVELLLLRGDIRT